MNDRVKTSPPPGQKKKSMKNEHCGVVPSGLLLLAPASRHLETMNSCSAQQQPTARLESTLIALIAISRHEDQTHRTRQTNRNEPRRRKQSALEQSQIARKVSPKNGQVIILLFETQLTMIRSDFLPPSPLPPPAHP
jgi:hypothetical protein